MSNSKKSIKFAHVQKITNQAILHGAHVEKMTKTSAVVFIKATKSPL